MLFSQSNRLKFPYGNLIRDFWREFLNFSDFQELKVDLKNCMAKWQKIVLSRFGKSFMLHCKISAAVFTQA